MKGNVLSLLPCTLSIVRLDAKCAFPAWVNVAGDYFLSITRTRQELSIVCDSSAVPSDAIQESGFRALRVDGPLDFQLVGVLSGLLRILAERNISVFTISTFDCDYILVRSDKLIETVDALTKEGRVVNVEAPSF